MKYVVAVAVSAWYLSCCAADFNIVEKKAEIESLSKEIEEISAYYAQASDTFLLQFAQLEDTLDEIGSSDEEIDDLVSSVAASLRKRISAAQAKYDSLFNTVSQLEKDASSMVAEVNNLANQRGLRAHNGEPTILHVNTYWENIKNHLNTLPNPIIWKSSGYLGGYVSDAFNHGTYSSPCDVKKCNCASDHGRSNIPYFNSVLEALKKSSLRVEVSAQHPPSF